MQRRGKSCLERKVSCNMTNVNAGPRLDRLHITRFHRRVFALVGIGMFLDGFDIYLASTVIGSTLKSGFATLDEAAFFVSATFAGMMIGSLAAGFAGDRYGRAFTYQINLALFGIASILAGFAWNMPALIVMRFLMGLGLGAENVVGYSAMCEFIPARSRGRWLSLMAALVSLGLPVSILLSTYLIPAYGWRIMFFVAGVSGLTVWWIRKALPESPRWLETAGRDDEAETLLRQVEAEAEEELPELTPVPVRLASSVSAAWLFKGHMLRRMFVGSITLMVIDIVIQGFVTWLPTFFIRQGMSLGEAFHFSLITAAGAPLGALLAAVMADRIGRKITVAFACTVGITVAYFYPTIKDPALLPLAGLALTAPMFTLIATLTGVYIPELFPTEIRLRAAGICNMFGRGAAMMSPFAVIALFDAQGIDGVISAMAGCLGVLAVVVLLFGVEPRRRTLEELGNEEPGSSKAASTTVAARLDPIA